MCKQRAVAKRTERFSLTAKRRHYFLLLEDIKSKQRYKVKINNIYDMIQEYDSYQIKNEELW